jgi:phage terminase large subunit GpA-like protein
MNISPLQKTELKAILKKTLSRFRPPEKLNVWQWAEKYRRLGKDVTAKPGRYRVAPTPYQREPQESFEDDDVQTTVLLWASRLGKTEMMNNLQGKKIHNDPMGILVCYPTLDSAKKWSKEFFMPMVRATPVLKRLIRNSKSRDSENTILSKRFPGGKVSAIGANSPSGFRQIQAPCVNCDEIDAMENGPEGDPVALAFKRADNYPVSIQVVSSTPTIKGTSRIEAFYESSDKRMWFCPCPKCGHLQTLRWAQVKWTFKNPDGTEESRPKDPVYVCESETCRAELNDDDRIAMVKAGEWRATAPFNGIRGYFLNGLNTLFSAKKGYKNKFHQIVAEFLDANKKGKHALMVWTNTFLAETWEDASEKLESSQLLKRREDYGPDLPENILVLTAGVDVQGDRLEIEVDGWANGEESWAVQYFVLPGNPLQQKVWKDLDELLERKFKTKDGRELRILATGVDSSAYTEAVLGYCKRRFAKRIFAFKGANQSGLPIAPLTPSRANRKKCPVYRIGTDTAKGLIYGRLKLEEHGPGFMHFPCGLQFGFDENYFSMLTAEEIRTRIVKGFPKREWHKTRPRNEALDIRVYSLAALVILQPDWTVLTKKLEQKVYQLKKAEEKPEPIDPNFNTAGVNHSVKEKPKMAPGANIRKQRSGFANKWKQ